MSSNPYERRGRARYGWPDAAAGGIRIGEGRLVGSVLTLEDVAAMASSVEQRTRMLTRRELDEQHEEALTEARRCAWDAGYAEGLADGRAATFHEFARAYGQEGIGAKIEAGDVIQKHREDPRRVSKSELVAALARLHEALTRFWGQISDG